MYRTQCRWTDEHTPRPITHLFGSYYWIAKYSSSVWGEGAYFREGRPSQKFSGKQAKAGGDTPPFLSVGQNLGPVGPGPGEVQDIGPARAGWCSSLFVTTESG